MLNNHVGQTVWVHLFGGAQDGFRQQIGPGSEPPRQVWVVRGNEDLMILEMSVDEQRRIQDRVELLAYELDNEVDELGEREIRYRRSESADRVPPD